MNPACPHLPQAAPDLRAGYPRQWKTSDPPRHYHACLQTAQSLWQQGLAAQALLQLNKALACEIDEPPVLPYAALCWIMEQPRPTDSSSDSGFLGNPIRHFQHLASRITPKVGPNFEIRRWRAWACFHLAEACLDHSDYPRDEQQITRECLEIPDIHRTLAELQESGWPNEVKTVRELLNSQPNI